MVERPFEDRRIVGPIFNTSNSDNRTEPQDIEPEFDSVDDLPDSPMLREYVAREAEYFDVEPEVIINSQPVKDYMKRLGVWEQAIREQR